MSERKVQYEFKVIVRADEWSWPHEVGDFIRGSVSEMAERCDYLKYEVVSVEQVRDGW